MKFMAIAVFTVFLASAACQDAGPKYAPVGAWEGLTEYNGMAVVLEGQISKTPWQHMISQPKGFPEISYFDFHKGNQTVLYSKTAIDCPGPLRVWGTVIEIKGESKRPGSEAPVVEYQIKVDRWECRK